MHICNECKLTGAMTDILMNDDCPNCDVCECMYCIMNMFGEDSDLCPLGNSCEDCNHIHAVTNCSSSNRNTIDRK